MPVAGLLERDQLFLWEPELLVEPPCGDLRVIVTGDREWVDYWLLCHELDRLHISELHHGDARGADRLAQQWALEKGVPSRAHRADWAQFGKAAGPIRNVVMLEAAKPDAVIAFKDSFGANPNGGTEHMVKIACAAAVPVRLICDREGRWL